MSTTCSLAATESLKGRKLKPEIKERWLKALPNYPRTKNRLRDSKGFCCLAVLGDLAVADGLATWELRDEKYSLVVPSEYRAEGHLLPGCLLEWALEDSSGLNKEAKYDFDYESSTLGSTLDNTLAIANDSNQTIEEISETIRTHY
jgi:hypothetical protein